MASLTRTTKNGKDFFKLQFTASGKRRTLYLGSIRESAANKVKNRIEDILLDVNLKNRLSEESQRWFLELDFKLASRLESWGLLATESELWHQKQNQDQPELFESKTERTTVKGFCDWYVKQRKSDCEESTVRKISASLNQFVEYCRSNESCSSVDDVSAEVAFRFKLYRQQSKAEATVAKDVKIAKTAFTFGMKAGIVTCNPFKELKAGSDVNLDGQHIIPIRLASYHRAGSARWLTLPIRIDELEVEGHQLVIQHYSGHVAKDETIR